MTATTAAAATATVALWQQHQQRGADAELYATISSPRDKSAVGSD